MNFEQLLYEWTLFFQGNGFQDSEYHEKRDTFFVVLRYINALMLQGINAKEKIALEKAQRNSLVSRRRKKLPQTDIRSYFTLLRKDNPVGDPGCISLQQLHYFIVVLKFEKAIWSKAWSFINFERNNSIERSVRWTEPKPNFTIKKTTQIAAYADSLLFSFRSRDHLIIDKLKDVNEIDEKNNVISTEIKRYKHIVENIHKESFCANHYHFIRCLMNNKSLDTRMRELTM